MATLARSLAVPRIWVRRVGLPQLRGYLLVLPAVCYVLLLIGFPLVLGIYYSLSSITVARPGHFVGLQNFVEIARDPTFVLSVRNTLIIGVVATAFKITLSVALA